jgi:hypothetical protein
MVRFVWNPVLQKTYSRYIRYSRTLQCVRENCQKDRAGKSFNDIRSRFLHIFVLSSIFRLFNGFTHSVVPKVTIEVILLPCDCYLHVLPLDGLPKLGLLQVIKHLKALRVPTSRGLP